jgi:Ca2+-binding EF-hand superfamily protein
MRTFTQLYAGNGYITTTVLREILKELDDKLTAQDLDLMIEEIDSDGSGTVDFDGKPHQSTASI